MSAIGSVAMDRLVLILLLTRLPCAVYTTRASPTPPTTTRTTTTTQVIRQLHQDCGLIYNGPSGSFQSPGYPNNYTNNLYCSQTFQVEDGKAVELKFENFDVEPNGCSCNDTVLIYDGLDSQSPLLRRLCGEHLPEPVYSTGRNLSIYLDTSLFDSRRGYNGTYRAVDVEFARTSQTTTSSRLPDQTSRFGPNVTFAHPVYTNDYISYRHNEKCGHTFEVREGQLVELNFDRFDIEHHLNCAYDSVKIYDGPNNQSTLLGTYCLPYRRPGIVRSTGHQLYMYFQTDASRILSGYQGSFRAVDFCNDPKPVWHMALRTEIDSQIPFNAMLFGSPGFSDNSNYSNSMTYGQTLEVSEGLHIELTFHNFQVEDHDNCNYDNVTIYDGPNRNSTRLGTYCGNTLPGPVISTGRQLYLYMQTNGSVTGRGFNGSYRSISDACGAFHRGTYGNFTSPEYPRRNHISFVHGCGQTFQVARGQVVQLTFETFETFDAGSSRDCNQNKLFVYDGPDRNSTLLASYCGREVPGSVTSTGRQLYLYIKGYIRFNGTYRAKFNYSCSTFSSQSSSFNESGRNASIQNHPWQVLLKLHINGQDKWCGGSIISRNWVITAAKCTKNTRNITVYAGSTTKTANRSQLFSVKRWIQHPNFNTYVVNDIALIEIDGDFNVTSATTRPVCLARANESTSFDGQSCVVTGWGYVPEESSRESVLERATVTVKNRSFCQNKFRRFRARRPQVKATHLCAEYLRGRYYFCLGERGGPLVCDRPDGTKVLAGVKSAGFRWGCSRRGRVSLYTHVSRYRQWIDETLATA